MSYVTASTSWKPEISLHRIPIAAVLRVCRQILHEYTERIWRVSVLNVSLLESNVLVPEALTLKPDILNSIKSSVRRITITMSWANFVPSDRNTRLRWLRQLQQYTPKEVYEQEGLPCTPSQEACDKIKHFLAVLQPQVSQEAQVRFNIHLEGLPNLHCPFVVDPHRTPRVVPTQHFWERTCFHVNTILQLEKDPSMTWPSPGTLKVRFYISTRAYCTRAKNSEALVANRREREAGVTDTVVVPDADASDAVIRWDLKPTEHVNSWRGFWPTIQNVAEFPE